MKNEEGWYGSTMETEKQRIEDPATGRPVILRQFRYQYNPWQKTQPKKNDLLTKDFITHLENRLWADNMEMIQFPKVTFTKKGFSVWATCQPKKGNQIPDYAKNQLYKPLHERLQEESKDNG